MKTQHSGDESRRDFHPEEYASRAERLREELDLLDLDAVLITHEPNLRWLVGYHITLISQIKWMTIALLFPRHPDKKSVLMCAADATGTDAAHISTDFLMCAADATGTDAAFVDKVRYWDEKLEPPFTANANPVSVLTKEIKECGLEGKRIGMELGEGMRVDLSQNDITALRQALPSTVLVNFTPSLWRLRSIKSNPEIEKITQAAKITMEGYKKGFDSIRPDMTDKELAAIICSRWLELGADSIGFIGIASTHDGMRYAHKEPADIPIREGEIVNVDGGARISGYWADMFRSVCVGEPRDKEQRRLVESIIEAKNNAIRAIRPGVQCGRVFGAAAETLHEYGFGHLLGDTSVGHGIGLDMHELPTLSKDSQVEIEENMVFCVEPWTVDYRDWSMGRNFEDMVRVTKRGAELLTLGLDNLVVV